MADVKPRVKVPSEAKKGEVITIKTLINHPMESGRRKDKDGNLIPRMIIHTFTCDFNGQTVFASDWQGSVSANPYLEFSVKVEESGTFKFTWVDDNGETFTDEKKITVN